MALRTFVDRDRRPWVVRPISREEWDFEPGPDNPMPRRTARPPGHESDPFELSREELIALLEAGTVAMRRSVPNPFKDG